MKAKIRFKDSWKGYDLPRGNCSDDFKQYLRDRELYFEPSSNGSYVHFEVKEADESCDLEVKAILKHYKYLKDSVSMSGLIKFLQEELEDLSNKMEMVEYNYDERSLSDREYEEQCLKYCPKISAIYWLLKAYGYVPKVHMGILGIYDKEWIKEIK